MARFQKGESGNPNGRPVGSRDSRSELRELLGSRSEAIVEKVVEKALEGDMTALKLCIDRLLPPLRATNGVEDIPMMEGSLVNRAESLLSALSEGRVTVSSANQIMRTLSSFARMKEVDELESRIEALEKSLHAASY